MTRVIGGSARGREIATPPGRATRPTTDRAREAIFSALEAALGSLHGRAFLDLYAGSGAVGLEAASRGAWPVVCVERDRRTAALIGRNARALALGAVQIVPGSVAAYLEGTPRTLFDVVFLDPPYDTPATSVQEVVATLAARGWLVADAIVAVERSRRSDPWEWPEGVRAVRDRRYGETIVWYGRAGDAPTSRETPAPEPVPAGEESQ